MSSGFSTVSPYAPLIAEATGASEADWGMIESLMRTEVFHSTLDWQSTDELKNGARLAFDLLEKDRAFFDLSRHQTRITFQQAKACEAAENLRHRLSELRSCGTASPGEITQAETDLDHAESHLAKLDEELRDLTQRLLKFPS